MEGGVTPLKGIAHTAHLMSLDGLDRLGSVVAVRVPQYQISKDTAQDADMGDGVTCDV